jgi:hypothetical protein
VFDWLSLEKRLQFNIKSGFAKRIQKNHVEIPKSKAQSPKPKAQTKTHPSPAKGREGIGVTINI